jgi:excisionase family DNA binding protein
MKRKPIKRRHNKRTAMASPEDAAHALGFSRNVVYALLRAKKLPANRVGKRYWIAWPTINRITNGELRLSMPAA